MNVVASRSTTILPKRQGRSRRPTLATSSPTLQPQTENLLDAGSLLCGHPDAVRRRLEQQQWKSQRDAERRKAASLEAQGLKWHQQPSSMISCTTPLEYKRMVEQAGKEGRLLVAKMFTEDCYVCKSLYPKMRKIAADNPDVTWVKLNGSDPAMVGLFASLGVSKVPLFHMVLDGELVAELTASLNPEKLAAFRAELAANKPHRQPTPARETAVEQIQPAAAALA